MKTLKYLGTLPGPTTGSALLSETYDFSSGVCDVDDADAALLLSRCGRSFELADATTVSRVTTRAAADSAAPLLAAAIISGKRLTLYFTEAASIVPTAVKTDFTVKYGITTKTVSKIEIGARLIDLFLATAAVASDVVTVSYANTVVTDPSGNAALAAVDAAVVNSTPDVTAPVIATAAVDGASLVLTYTEDMAMHTTRKAVPGDFAVLVDSVANPVTSVTVHGSNKTVTLALTTAVISTDVVTVSYTKSAHATAYTQDTSYNAAANLVAMAVTNNTTADSTAPVLATAVIIGDSLVLTYTEAIALDPVNKAVPGDYAVVVDGSADVVTSVTVDGSAKTVTLALTSAAVDGDVCTVSYTKSASETAYIQDTSGNAAGDLVTQAITNSTPDVTVPVLASAVITGDSLVLTYTELNDLDEVNKAVPGDYTVIVNGGADVVTSVTVGGAAKTVTLALTSAATSGQVCTVSYTKSVSETAYIQDVSGNAAANLVAQAITNSTP